MADAPRNPEPPKIKLNIPGTKPPVAAAPPRLKIKPAEKKSETARIDLAAAQPPPPGPAPDFQELTKEELAEFYKKSTIRIDTTAPEVGDTRQVAAPPPPDEAMRTTMRVDDAATSTGETHKVQADGVGQDTAKRSTLRVDGTPAPGDTKRVKSETQGGTMRVDGADRKSETAKLEVPVADKAKKITARVAIDAASSGENDDVFKKRTIPVSVPSMAPPPAPPKSPTVTMTRPKTMVMRPVGQRPQPPKVAVTPVESAAVTEAKKSETARLDLPPDSPAGDDRPSTRPKTIRIKRPDGTSGRKPLMITRPDEAAAAAPAAAAEVAVVGEDEPHALFSVAALLAVLVTLGLIYLLVGQTVAPELPLPNPLA